MNEIVYPSRPWLRVLNWALRLYLSLVLAGCASKQKSLTVEEIRQLETRNVNSDFTTAFDASVNLLQDLGFTIDLIDTETGVITAGKQTEEELGELFPDIEKDDGLPTWAIVLLIITGIVIIIGLIIIAIAIFSSSDDDEEKETKGEDDGKQSRTVDRADIKDDESKPTRSKGEGSQKDTDEERSTREKGESERQDDTDVEEISTTAIIADAMLDDSDDFEYNDYRITLNLEPLGDTETKIRTSVQRIKMRGNRVEETGPVYDGRFFVGFYTHLDKALSLEAETVEPETDTEP
jgi:hypothetical protein